MKRIVFIISVLVILSCGNDNKKATNYPTKQLDLKGFKITVPGEWEYKKSQGIDSYVGEIVGPKVSLSFDYSSMGYANHLIYSEKEWLEREEVGWSRSLDITYTNTPKKLMTPSSEQKKIYPKVEYIVKLDLKDSTILLPINLPEEIKAHNIILDTTDKFAIKTIYPKNAGKGITGIYIQSRNSSFNFQMSAHDLPKKQQEQALQAFKTIKFK